MSDHIRRGRLHSMQVWQLRQPITKNRVLKDGKGMSHLSQQDVVAHLTRVFGFGNFDTEILDLTVVYEERVPNPKNPNFDPNANNPDWRYNVCYKALVRLTVRNMEGDMVAFYEDVSTDTATNQKTRGDAHDLASKSAVSLAKKRCAVHLGDQFGASLYNKGQTAPLVVPMGSVTLPEHIEGMDRRGEESQAQEAPAPDMQEGVPQQVDMGNVDPESAPAPQVDPQEVQGHLNRAGGQQQERVLGEENR